MRAIDRQAVPAVAGAPASVARLLALAQLGVRVLGRAVLAGQDGWVLDDAIADLT